MFLYRNLVVSITKQIDLLVPFLAYINEVICLALLLVQESLDSQPLLTCINQQQNEQRPPLHFRYRDRCFESKRMESPGKP